MALPKTRISKARGRKGRTHYKAGHVQTAICAQCSQQNYRTAPVLIADTTAVVLLFQQRSNISS